MLKKLIPVLVLLIFARPVTAQQQNFGGGGGGGTSIPWQNQGSAIGTPSVAINCSTNMTCTFGTGTVTLTSSATSSTAFSSLTASSNNNSGTFTATGNSWDFSGVTLFKARVAASLTTAANGAFGYDSNNSNWHGYQNGADSYLFSGPVGNSYTNNNCTKFSVASGVITLVDAGAPCGGGSGTVNSGTSGHIAYYASSTTAVSSDTKLDDGATTANTLTYTGTGGITATTGPISSTGSGAGYTYFGQGADNCVANQPANSVCWEAPSSVGTAYHALFAGTPSTGIPHYSYSAPTLTETISAIVGSDMSTNTVTATQLAAQYSKRSCVWGLGDGTNAISAATYPSSGQMLGCPNNSGVTWTVTGIHCFTDNAGTSTLNVYNNAASSLLTGAVTCNATKTNGGAAGSQSGTTTIATTDGLNFVFVADGTSKYVTAIVDFTY